MVYKLKTIKGYETRIRFIRERMETFKRLRGTVGNGTFWENVQEVDDSLLRMEMEIYAYELCIEELNHPKNLIGELKSSEIF